MNEIEIPENVLFQEVGDEAVLLSLDKGHYFGLDEIGTHIWNLIKEKKNAEEIIAVITEEYDVEAEQFKQDLDDFVTELQESGLITP